ncbi:hypothetical protein H311_04102 [Anncaliia algerae PRA109]|nr:hypothetical protein H311_04102 [Anncaliia algerae PRA109]
MIDPFFYKHLKEILNKKWFLKSTLMKIKIKYRQIAWHPTPCLIITLLKYVFTFRRDQFRIILKISDLEKMLYSGKNTISNRKTSNINFFLETLCFKKYLL